MPITRRVSDKDLEIYATFKRLQQQLDQARAAHVRQAAHIRKIEERIERLILEYVEG
jgi:hypothetical protein